LASVNVYWRNVTLPVGADRYWGNVDGFIATGYFENVRTPSGRSSEARATVDVSTVVGANSVDVPLNLWWLPTIDTVSITPSALYASHEFVFDENTKSAYKTAPSLRVHLKRALTAADKLKVTYDVAIKPWPSTAQPLLDQFRRDHSFNVDSTPLITPAPPTANNPLSTTTPVAGATTAKPTTTSTDNDATSASATLYQPVCDGGALGCRCSVGGVCAGAGQSCVADVCVYDSCSLLPPGSFGCDWFVFVGLLFAVAFFFCFY
jgi:hypothetical protein